MPAVGAAVGEDVGVSVGAAVGTLVSPMVVGAAVGAPVGAAIVKVTSQKFSEPISVYGPAKMSPPGAFSVTVAPYQPPQPPQLLNRWKVCSPDPNDTSIGLADQM
jgi:hypothetical protein